ncbi:HlyD family secretion protein [Thalassotalea sp. HSM 43]|uniref:HlyD family secretion protein n=1 Tax=Thalassotalea sp. HSM 43 TaxID=2552945 RepID=UPI0010811D29|nr:HlyD family secretion protein [Thalassotalea sp. HSM 43]QBY04850.1 HlyD family secretion protein [Thalassotalea sp. HSM 43]
MSSNNDKNQQDNGVNDDSAEAQHSSASAAESETKSEAVDAKASEEKPAGKAAKPDFAKRFSKITLSLALLYFLWYVIGDRVTPISDQGRIRAFVIPVVPQVAGKVSKIYVGGDKVVKKDQVLFEIDDRDYQLALEKAKANLELTGQEIGADTAVLDSAKARLDQAKADLEVKKINTSRVFILEQEGIISGFDGDRARGVLTQAELAVVDAEAGYEQAKQKLGKEGKNNPKLLSALAELSTARLNLSRTKVSAPSDGVVSYAKINVGYYAAVGQQIMTFIGKDTVWIEASFRENNLGNLKSGDPVDIILDSAPGQIFKGSIGTIGFGVNFDKNEPGALPTPEKPTGWMRDPQRFSVNIIFDKPDSIPKRLLREGGQVSVIAYTEESNIVFDKLGKAWAWVTSYMSYLY